MTPILLARIILLSTLVAIMAYGAPLTTEKAPNTTPEPEKQANTTGAAQTNSTDLTQDTKEKETATASSKNSTIDLTNDEDSTERPTSEDVTMATKSGQLTVSEAAEVLKRDAQTAGSAAYLTYNYILTNFLGDQVPPPAQPCFSEERSARELDGHIHPGINYLQRLVEDHASLTGYLSYLTTVEEQYNQTLNKTPTCGYCVRFLDLKALTEKLLTSLENMIKTVDPNALTNAQQAQNGTDLATTDDPCYEVCFNQQARVYLRYEAFASVYIVNDVNGILQQKLDSKKN